MPKGKTNAPLSILIIGEELYESSSVQQLKEQGHEVNFSLHTTMDEYDRIYGANCYRMTPELLPFLPLSLKQARLEKKARAVKEDK